MFSASNLVKGLKERLNNTNDKWIKVITKIDDDGNERNFITINDVCIMLIIKTNNSSYCILYIDEFPITEIEKMIALEKVFTPSTYGVVLLENEIKIIERKNNLETVEDEKEEHYFCEENEAIDFLYECIKKRINVYNNEYYKKTKNRIEY